MSDTVADLRQSLAPMLAEAEAALARRQEQYPSLIASNRLSEDAAAQDLRTWSAIVADWRRIMAGQPFARTTSDSQADISDRIAALDESLRRYATSLDKAIAAASIDIQRDCADISDVVTLAERHGGGVATILALRDKHDRIWDMRAVYWSIQLRSGYYWRGLWRGVDAWLDFHRQHRAADRADRADRKADA